MSSMIQKKTMSTFPDDDTKKKIKVEIKPVQANGNPPISASVDELRSAIGGLELLPNPVVGLKLANS